MANIKILMADDEEEILTIMAKRIEREGYEVIAVGDGQQAWDKIQSEAPDIIILDLNMPYKDGFQVLRLVREQDTQKVKWQPVIIVSARRELEDMKQGYELEADHYISKPCRMEDILKAIKLMLQLRQQRCSGE